MLLMAGNAMPPKDPRVTAQKTCHLAVRKATTTISRQAAHSPTTRTRFSPTHFSMYRKITVCTAKPQTPNTMNTPATSDADRLRTSLKSWMSKSNRPSVTIPDTIRHTVSLLNSAERARMRRPMRVPPTLGLPELCLSLALSRAASVSDSGMKKHTYSTQQTPHTQAAAAVWVASNTLPMAGPKITPTLKAAMRAPNPAARCTGGIKSAIQANEMLMMLMAPPSILAG
mmetsp:Transcript_11664/g.35014  ORF Transcript_11664/g.35014 Transcript_11664/m.35014 type:complete len:228 (+) Transcript_11664:2177-2860(+)